MASWDRRAHKPRRRTPSFSSSLLDVICDSIDEQHQAKDFVRRTQQQVVEEEIESLRRAIKVEKWMENYNTTTTTTRHFSSNSYSSNSDSSIFSSSETEYSSASRSTPSSSLFSKHRLKFAQTPPIETTQKCEGRFTRTKSRALKLYGDLKRAKEPTSPCGGKIANFLNSLFSPKSSKKHVSEDRSSMKKSRSTKDTTTTRSSVSSRSCLAQKPSSSCNKPKRSVKFSPSSVILDHKDYGHLINSSIPSIATRRNLEPFRQHEEKKLRKHEMRIRELLENVSDDDEEEDEDDMSCVSSELFELESIGRVGIGAYDEELPVYGTTSMKMNQAIARGFII